jgi:putative hydrolase of the HAD superfamily
MPKAIIFDLDDTIISEDAVTEQVWRNTCLRFAPYVDGLKAESLYGAIRQAREWYWADPERHRLGRLNMIEARRDEVKLAFSNLHIDSPDLAGKIADIVSIESEKAVYLFPEAIGTLKHLKKRGVLLALITNGASGMQRAKIQRFGLEPFFNSILVEGEFGSGKPDSRIFTYTLQKLNINSADAWMVGDDLERDIAPCQPLGIFSIWVDWNGTGLPASARVTPDKIIKNIAELLPLSSIP